MLPCEAVGCAKTVAEATGIGRMLASRATDKFHEKDRALKKEKGDGNALTCPTSLTKTLFPQLKEPFPFAYENVVQTTVPLFVSSLMIL